MKQEKMKQEKMKFTDKTKNFVFNFVTSNIAADFDEDGNPILKIQNSNGIETIRFGDTVIKDENGEFKKE